MLINLSNHPVSEWKQAQLQAAQPYGKIKDFPFPKIDPTWKPKHIFALAKQICREMIAFKKQAGDELFAVHIMGELTFVYSLVCLLQQQNIACLVSTSPRRVYKIEGKKLACFSFTKFREYPKLVR